MRELIRKCFLGTFFPVFVTAFLSFAAIFWISIPTLEKGLMNGKREMIREQTRTVLYLIREYQERVKSGELTITEAHKRVIDRIRKL